MNNHPEKWAESFMQNVNEGPIIPFNHRLRSSNVPRLNYIQPNTSIYSLIKHTPREPSSNLPTLKKTLRTLSSNTPEFIPTQPPPPTTMYAESYKAPSVRYEQIPIYSEEDFINRLLDGKRIYVNYYDRAQWPEFISYYLKNKDVYHIRYHSYDIVDDVKTSSKNPYYWISKNPPKNRKPLSAITQGMRRKRKQRTQRKTRRR
jgi:hypothetical protein